MKNALAVTAAVATLAAPALAGPLRPARVGADADWVVHVDVEALHRSRIGRFVLENAEGLGIDMSGFRELREEIGMDPRSDLMSVTAWGPTAADEDDGIIVAIANSNADEALVRAMARPDVDAVLHDVEGYPVHALTSDGETIYVHVRPERGRRLVVLGDDEAALLRAIAVIDGRTDSAEDRESIPRRPRSGSIVFAAARDAGFLESFEPASDIARLSDMVTIDVGEHEGALFAHGAISAGNDQDARDIAQVVQGLIALGRLVAGEDPDLAPLRDIAAALRVRADGPRIDVEFVYDTAPVIEALEEAIREADDGDRDRHGEDDDHHDDDHDDRDHGDDDHDDR